MGHLLNIMEFVLEGFALCSKNRSPFRLIIVIFFSGLFAILFYINFSAHGRRIASAIIAIFITIIKFVFLCARRCLDSAVDLSASDSEPSDRPDHLSSQIWQFLPLFVNPTNSIDLIVSDLIASGVDQDELLKLLDYIETNQYSSVPPSLDRPELQTSVIIICGRALKFPISPATLTSLCPLNHTIPFVIISGVLQFTSTDLTLNSAFSATEKWWIAIVLGFSTFSVLFPPPVDPYMSRQNDCWHGGSRPLAITFLSGLFRLAKELRPPRVNLNGWEIITPYVLEIARYGILLLPIWTLFGFVNHPKAIIMTLLESINRYAFGQSGATSFAHWGIQTVRGCVSVVTIWGILQIGDSSWLYGLAFALSTFINCATLHPFENLLAFVAYPFASAAAVFLLPHLTAFFNFELPAKVSILFLLSIEIIIPYLSVRNSLLGIRLWPCPDMVAPLRWWLSSVLCALPIVFLLYSSDQPSLLIAFTATHAIQKAHSDRHWFVIACILGFFTFPGDFGLSSKSLNFFLSLLIVTKCETFFPVLRLISLSRFGWTESLFFSGIDVWAMYRFAQMFPFFDSLYKFPSIVWSFFTGASLKPFAFRDPFFLGPGPVRPLSFFDWPISNDSQNRSADVSPARSFEVCLAKHFASLAYCGRFGLVHPGDVFMFHNPNLLFDETPLMFFPSLVFFVHVVAAEPNQYRIQIRAVRPPQYSLEQIENFTLLSRLKSFLASGVMPMFAITDILSLNALNSHAVDFETLFPADQSWPRPLFLMALVVTTAFADHEILDGFLLQRDSADDVRDGETDLVNRVWAEVVGELPNPELLARILGLWALFSRALCDDQNRIVFGNLTAFYKGSFVFEDGGVNIDLIAGIFTPSVRLAVAAQHLRSADRAPESDIAHIVDVRRTVLCLGGVDAIEQVLTSEARLAYMMLSDDSIVQLEWSELMWDVTFIEGEWVRAVWSAIETEVSRGRPLVLPEYVRSPNFGQAIAMACGPGIGDPIYVSDVLISQIRPTEWGDTPTLESSSSA